MAFPTGFGLELEPGLQQLELAVMHLPTLLFHGGSRLCEVVSISRFSIGFGGPNILSSASVYMRDPWANSKSLRCWGSENSLSELASASHSVLLAIALD